jgi:excinuclease ABC subunit B
VVEQLIRPTGLVDPEVEVRPTYGQIDDLIDEIKKALRAAGTRAGHHSDQEDGRGPERVSSGPGSQGALPAFARSRLWSGREILRDLRLGVHDVIVGINLLSEGLDLPEVSLVAILDADKEGFLRSETSLIQTMGRAARNVRQGHHVCRQRHRLHAPRHRRDQPPPCESRLEYNEKHGITPPPSSRPYATTSSPETKSTATAWKS